MKSFEGRVAAVTGAGSGIGRELVIQLVRSGCHVAASDINPEGLQQTLERARASAANGVQISSTVLDVSNREAVHAWADQVEAEHGKANLIFNNAGVAHGTTVEGMRYEDFEWIMGINFWGVVYGTKAFLPLLRRAGEGHVINISSVFGIISVPTQGSYNASKFAVRGFTEALCQELQLEGGALSATSVHPGGIKTNIANAARMDDSTRSVTGMSHEDSKRNFEKLFRTTAEKAAQVILDGVRKNRRRVLIGGDARMIDLVQRLLPSSYQRLLEALTRMQRPKN